MSFLINSLEISVLLEHSAVAIPAIEVLEGQRAFAFLGQLAQVIFDIGLVEDVELFQPPEDEGAEGRRQAFL